MGEIGVVAAGQEKPTDFSVSPVLAAGSLTFEEQRELLRLQLEHNRMKQNTNIETQLAVEKMRCEAEQTRLALERHELDLMEGVDGNW